VTEENKGELILQVSLGDRQRFTVMLSQ